MTKSSSLICMVMILLLWQTAAQATTLKIATLAPAGTTWIKLMKKGSDEISEKTEGRVKLKFYPGGVMGNDQSVHRKIRINQLQGGAFSSSGMGHLDTSIQALSLPMMFNNFDEVDYVRQHLDERIKKHVADNGFILLGITEGGFARIMSTRDIQSLQDIRASKVWLPEGDELVAETYSKLGISPIPLPIAEVYTGLQTGLIETIAATSTGAIALQWHSQLKHMVDTPVLYVIGLLVISERAFARIAPEDQQVVIEVMNDVFQEIGKINRADNLAATRALAEQDIEVREATQNDINEWRKFSEKSIDSMIAKGIIDADIVKEIRRLLTEYRGRQG